jgi:hypothetical protein
VPYINITRRVEMYKIIFKLFFTVSLSIMNLYAQNGYPDWSYSAKIMINSTSGLGLSGNVTDFPVLVRLDQTFPFNQTSPNGNDIRFSKSNGNGLSFEIELWDAAGDEAVIWVKIDTVYQSTPQVITIYWGNNSVESESNGVAVFAPANGFSGVWHMSESPTGANAIPDRTGNGFHGSPVGNMTAGDVVSGVAGRALDFDGTDDYLDLGTIDSDFSGGVTLCGWMNYDNFNTWSRLLDFGNAASDNAIFIGNIGNSNDVRWELWASGASTLDVYDVLSQNTWIYLCGTAGDDGNMVLYVDGEPAGSQTGQQAPNNVSRTSCAIARSNWGADALYDGQLDEIRLSTEARSADWIMLNYQTQRAGNNLVGEPVIGACSEEFSVSTPGPLQANESQSVSLSGTATCGFFTKWTLVTDSMEVLIGEGPAAEWSVGRVAGNTDLTVRFSSVFETGYQTQDITVQVQEGIPEPEFTLEGPDGAWNGVDPLVLRPVISNLAAVQASSAPDINYTWDISGIAVSRTEDGDSIQITNAREDGDMRVTLCLENGGPVLCDSVVISVGREDPITVTAPNGGEELTTGSTYTITWRTAGDISNVHIQYQLDGGSWRTLALNIENTGTHEWSVPLTPAQEAKIRVVSATGGLLDESDGTFSIVEGVSVQLVRAAEGLVMYLNGSLLGSIGGEAAEITILDVNGTPVRILPVRTGRAVWDGRDSSGRPVHAGVYVVRVKNDRAIRYRKVVMN